MERYPVYIGADRAGELTVGAEGLLTRLEARCSPQSGIVRLYVYGEGKTAYLGTMMPDGDGLSLIKKLSRSELAAFPRRIEYASDAPLPQSEPDTLWYEYKNGVLKSADGGLIAFPAGGRGLPKERLRSINGRSYIVFSGKKTGAEPGNVL